MARLQSKKKRKYKRTHMPLYLKIHMSFVDGRGGVGGWRRMKKGLYGKTITAKYYFKERKKTSE